MPDNILADSVMPSAQDILAWVMQQLKDMS